MLKSPAIRLMKHPAGDFLSLRGGFAALKKVINIV